MKNSTHMLVQDQSSHWYVIPRDRKSEWNDWCELDEDDEASWDAPEWATRVGGAPSLVTFTEDGFTIDD